MSAVTEVPGVNSAVEKLQELGARLKTEDVNFKEKDINNLTRIVEALNELEEERKLMHEKLEIETIKSSILRHELNFLPGQIRDEIMNAVNAARQSNADALKTLQEKLENINNNIVQNEKIALELENENAILHPEKELLHQQHEEIISQLNQKMADKAMTQIALNETRDKVRQTNQDMEDLEDGILQLKEELIQERTEARVEKKRLKKAVIATQTKTKEQREQNIEKKNELDLHQEKLLDSQGKLDVLKKSIQRYEASRNKLETDETALISHLEQQHKLMEHQRRKGADVINQGLREEQDFENKQKTLHKRLKILKSDITRETERTDVLEQRRTQLYIDVQEKQKITEDEAKYVEQLDLRLQAAKENLSEKAEEFGRMQTENTQMADELISLEGSHKAVLAQLNNQIEEHRDQLARERNERIELQRNKDVVGSNLQNIKTDQQQFIMAKTAEIQEGKKKHVDLSNEGVSLQNEIKKDEVEIQALDTKLKALEKSYEEMFTSCQQKVDTLQSEIGSMENEISQKKLTLLEKIPEFQEYEEFFNRRNEEYDTVKKSIVVLKNKKLSLEDTMKRTKREQESLKVPQATLLNDLKENRSLVMKQIQSQADVTNEMEQQIFLAGCQLRMVMEENQRFEKACKKLEEELAELEKQKLENEKVKLASEENLITLKNELTEKWEKDKLMQEFFAIRDEKTAEAFGCLMEKTGKREMKIDGIAVKMKAELEVLSDFLDTIATRRPHVFLE
ncbi:trichohyalin-like isoform X2 [Physella acuta]|uniref:trichohyalin-like isoform X2 n=1 Tax=Physella acuta TaxID=109671 RepID=UPI0027DE8215|nr:trichohyalin-like isoform X2 [Physella acuta]